MAGNPTSFARRFEEYSAILLGFTEKNPKLAEFYGAFNQSLANLNEAIAALTGENSETVLSGDRLNNLKSLYSQAMEATETYINSVRSKSDASAYVAGEIAQLLHRDSEVIGRIPQSSNVRLSDAFRSARTLCIDIGRQRVATAGNLFSSRMPVQFTDQNGNVRQGFFTPNFRLNDKNGLLDMFQARYPKYEQVWSMIRNTPSLYNKLTEENEILAAQKNIRSNGKLKVDIAFSGNEADPIREYLPIETYDRLVADTEFRAIFSQYRKQEYTQDIRDTTYTDKQALNADTGSSVTDRNCAMSSVAKLLGTENVLANSQRTVLVQNGHKLEGCFMETADGYDPDHLDITNKNNLMWSWATEASFQNLPSPRVSGNALRQMADLQVLDYLCGNLDRHLFNFCYRFKKDADGNTVLDGVMGIDNDESFGKDTFATIGKQHNLGIEGLAAIPLSTAQRILSLTPENLNYVLADYGLSLAEKNAALERLELLQNHIAHLAVTIDKDDPIPRHKKQDDRPLYLVDDSRFDEIPISLLSKTLPTACFGRKNNKRNLFAKIDRSAVPSIIDEYTGFKKSAPPPIPYSDGKLSECGPLTRDSIVSQFIDIATLSNNLYKDAWWNTSEFKTMRTALNRLTAAPKDLSTEQTMALCDDLLAKTQTYIDLKKDAPETLRGRERLTFARRLRDLCSELQDEQRDALLRSGSLPARNREKIIGDGDNLQQEPSLLQQISLLENTSRSGMLTALKGNHTEQATQYLTELLYYSKVLDHARQHGEAPAKKLLAEDTVNRNLEELKPLAQEILSSKDPSVLQDILNGANPAAKFGELAGAALNKQTASSQVKSQDTLSIKTNPVKSQPIGHFK